MRSRLKLALVLAIACASVVGITACGGGSDTAATTSGNANNASDAVPIKPSEVSGTITVWDFYTGSFPNYDPINNKLLAEFEAKFPKVTVDQVPQPFEGRVEQNRAAFTAQEGPDVLMMISGEPAVSSRNQGLEVLNDRITPELQDQITNWGTATPGYQAEGEHYGVPIGTNGQVFYYNKELFQKAGLPREFEPETWDEVREAGEKLKAAGIQPFTGGDKEGAENTWWFSAGWTTANTVEEITELADGDMPYTDEAVTRAMEPEIMMEDAGLYPDDRFTTPLFPDGVSRFGNEEAAMVLSPQAVIGYWGEFNKSLGEKNVGMFLPPGAKFLGTEAEYAWTIPTFTKNPDAAWAFIEFMTSKESISKFVDAELFLPNRKDVPLPAGAPEQPKQIVKWNSEYELFPNPHSILPSQALEPGLTTEMNEVLQGRTSLESVQQSMQETVEKTTR